MEIVMPKVGLTMTEGTLAQWHKREGDRVRKGEVLFTFESEKSTLSTNHLPTACSVAC